MIYVFGNEYLEEDSMARRVSEHLDAEVTHCRSPEELLEVDDEPIVILDVVKGVDEPVLITDHTKLKSRALVSLHDLDLGYFLNLLEAMGRPKHIRIIGVPEKGDAAALAREVSTWI